MAVTAVKAAKAWLAGSAAAELSPAARLTLVLLCEGVNENRLQAGEPWEVWPAQPTLARLVGVTPRQVRRILRETLATDCRVIRDTGEIVGRGIVKWEVDGSALGAVGDGGPDDPSSGPTPDTHVPPDISVPPDTSDRGEGGHQLPGGRTPAPGTPDMDDREGGHRRPTEPEGNAEPEPEAEQTLPPTPSQGRGRRSRRRTGGGHSGSSDSSPYGKKVIRSGKDPGEDREALLELEGLLAETATPALRASLERRISKLRDALGSQAEIDETAVAA